MSPVYHMFRVIVLIVFFAYAGVRAGWAGALSVADIDRIKAFKLMVKDVDPKSLNQTVAELEKSPHPRLNLEIKEAIARAYVDIVREKKVGRKDKEWLYSKISLNMAYLQFSGGDDDNHAANPLDIFIRQKLKHYLPADIFNRSGFHYDLG